MISTDQKETLMISLKGMKKARNTAQSRLNQVTEGFERKRWKSARKYLTIVNRGLRLMKTIKALDNNISVMKLLLK